MATLEKQIRNALGLDRALSIGFDGGELFAECPCGARPTLNRATPLRCRRCSRVWRIAPPTPVQRSGSARSPLGPERPRRRAAPDVEHRDGLTR
jgi:hypothetical protein